MNLSFVQRKSHPIIGANPREKGGRGEVGRRGLLTAAAQWINEINRAIRTPAQLRRPRGRVAEWKRLG